MGEGGLGRNRASGVVGSPPCGGMGCSTATLHGLPPFTPTVATAMQCQDSVLLRLGITDPSDHFVIPSTCYTPSAAASANIFFAAPSLFLHRRNTSQYCVASCATSPQRLSARDMLGHGPSSKRTRGMGMSTPTMPSIRLLNTHCTRVTAPVVIFDHARHVVDQGCLSQSVVSAITSPKSSTWPNRFIW